MRSLRVRHCQCLPCTSVRQCLTHDVCARHKSRDMDISCWVCVKRPRVAHGVPCPELPGKTLDVGS